MSEDAKDFFDDNAERWDEISPHDAEKVRYIVDLLELKGNESILDVGTGTGIMIPFYEEHLENGTVTAIDRSANMINTAKRKYPEGEHPNISFETKDLYEIKDGSTFDVAVCYSCFPHFSDKGEALRILCNALRHQGKLMISHSCSRKRINEIHRDGCKEISKDHLPPMKVMRRFFDETGFHVYRTQDDERFFIIIGRKKKHSCNGCRVIRRHKPNI